MAPSGSRRVGLAGLVALIYLVVSGGPYGFEETVRDAGAGLAVILCLVIPLTVSLPTALMAAELGGLMPVEGGFYAWVKEACGPFAGFLEAYLTLLYTAADMALYPVLFGAYLSYLWPVSAHGQTGVALAMVWAAALVNLWGARPVGRVSLALLVLVLAPFGVMAVRGFGCVAQAVPAMLGFPARHPWSALGQGLTVAIWNFSGWENLSTIGGEIENPAKTYPRALLITVPLVAAGYLVPLLIGLCVSPSSAAWRPGYFTEVGRRIGGPGLATALALGGAVGAWAVFQAATLWVSRMPFVLSRDGYLPPLWGRVWRRTETPAAAVLLSSLVFSLLVPLGFGALVLLDVFFYMAALVLEMVALLRLRRRYPDRSGRFMIGGGALGLWLAALLPILTWLSAFVMALLGGERRVEFAVAVALALLSWPIYRLLAPRSAAPVAKDRRRPFP